MKEFQLLVEAIEKAQQKGVYSLQEVQMILNAIGTVAGELQKIKAKEQDVPVAGTTENTVVELKKT